MHDGQLVVDEELAGDLIAREFPPLSGLPVVTVRGAGTVCCAITTSGWRTA